MPMERSTLTVHGSHVATTVTIVTESRQSRLHEIQRLPLFTHPRPALPRARLGRSIRAEDLPAARLDGRVGVVPVRRRRIQARLACDRAGLARLRSVGMD